MRTDHGDRALQDFIDQVSRRLDERTDEAAVRRDVGALLADLVAHDDWLPGSHAQPGADRYRQYLLHRDPRARFSVVSFVWGPGQATPIHDHTVWGLIGVLRGAELSQGYRFAGPTKLVPAGAPVRLEQGAVDAVSPSVGAIPPLANAVDDPTAISLHGDGADIGAVERSVYTEDGQRRSFVSGYSPLP